MKLSMKGQETSGLLIQVTA